MQTIREAEQSRSKHIPLVSHILVVGVKQFIVREYEKYAKALEIYNRRLKDLTDNRFVVRQTHTSNGRTYHGRYVNERYWCKIDKRIKQRYFGKALPEDIKGEEVFKRTPSAPVNPLEGLECQLMGENAIMTPAIYEKFFNLFGGAFVVPIAGGVKNDD
ncbi:MAG: hypothetical protein GQ580_06015 [Candidatus Thorarchaeota archaeon]|nr:hypothetical protein [Candidatus Thorarchaeota archaeon]